MDVGLWLFLIFVGLPIIEIALFIKVGGAIGLVSDAGDRGPERRSRASLIMRWQGLQALDRLRTALQAGGDPVGPIAHGALILVAGILLILPGFFTDALGLLLLVPPVRTQLISWGASGVTVRAAGYVRPAASARAAGGDRGGVRGAGRDAGGAAAGELGVDAAVA